MNQPSQFTYRDSEWRVDHASQLYRRIGSAFYRMTSLLPGESPKEACDRVITVDEELDE